MLKKFIAFLVFGVIFNSSIANAEEEISCYNWTKNNLEIVHEFYYGKDNDNVLDSLSFNEYLCLLEGQESLYEINSFARTLPGISPDQQKKILKEAQRIAKNLPSSLKFKKKRIICMVNLLQDEMIDDRILMQDYLEKYSPGPGPSPDEVEVENCCMGFAKLIFFNDIVYLKERFPDQKTKPYKIALGELHDLIHRTYFQALLPEIKTTQGGSSALPPSEIQYHDWISKMMRNEKSIYYSWSDQCG